jgi:hypothetical protein
MGPKINDTMDRLLVAGVGWSFCRRPTKKPYVLSFLRPRELFQLGAEGGLDPRPAGNEGPG